MSDPTNNTASGSSEPHQNVDSASASSTTTTTSATNAANGTQDPWVSMPRRPMANGLAGSWSSMPGFANAQQNQQMVQFDMHAALHDACKAGSMDAFQYVIKLPGVDVCILLSLHVVLFIVYMFICMLLYMIDKWT